MSSRAALGLAGREGLPYFSFNLNVPGRRYVLKW